MESLIKPSPRSRRTHQQIQDLLTEFSRSGCTVNEFCLEHHLHTAAFYKWQTRYKNNSLQKDKRPGFAAIAVTPSPDINNGKLFAEIKGIKIYQPVAASYLKELAS